MKQIAIVHTVQSVADTFGKSLREFLGGDVKIYNIWDDFLAINANELGEFTINNKNRLFADIKNAESTGADAIVISCSTLTPHLDYIRPFIGVPVIAIDDAMTELAVTLGEKILVAATARSTIGATTDKIYADAAKAGRRVEVSQMVISEAFEALKVNDLEKHDRILVDAMKDVSGYDCIVLAQASMAPCMEAIEKACGIRTLSSPRLCMERVGKTLGIL